MHVLIVGGGGREHALAWKAAQSPLADRVSVAPGNGGTSCEPGVANVDIAATDIDALLAYARAGQVGLVIIGPEAPLVAGLADACTAAGIPCFGPNRAAAQLEGSKTFAKAFLSRHGIPTAAYQSFSERTAALEYLKVVGAPVVIKADGLAAGKGVVLAVTLAEAEAAIEDMLGSGRFGAAGQRVVIEQFLTGEEVSFIAMVSGETILPLATSQDHKARDDGDRGPNTGGMGAYSPAPVVTPVLHERIMREVMRPTVAGLSKDGIHYVGFLYAGLMIGTDGTPWVLEFNCRLGDPETQPILMRLAGDLVAACLAGAEGHLDEISLSWRDEVALGVVLAAEGYPEAYRSGDPIHGLTEAGAEDVKVFHAGTRATDDGIVTAGGRVLCVTALAPDVAAAADRAYAGVARIGFDGAFCRRDIGHRAIARVG